MRPFFLVSCYEKTASDVLIALLDACDKFSCHSGRSNLPLPSIPVESINKMIDEHRDDPLIPGGVFCCSYYDLKIKVTTEKVNHPVKMANIVLPINLGVRQTLYTWLNSGIQLQELFAEMSRQLLASQEEGNVFKTNNVQYFQQLLLSNLTPYHQHHRESIFSLSGQLFLLASAIALAFDATSAMLKEENFDYSKLLTQKSELDRFLKFLSNNEVSLTDELYDKILPILHAANRLEGLAGESKFENWQQEVLQAFSIHAKNIYWTQVQSPFFMLIQQAHFDIDQPVKFNHQFVFFEKSYAEVIRLTPMENMFYKEKILNPERIKRAKEDGVYLLYDLSGEALTFCGETDQHWLAFHKILHESGIPGDQVYLLCSNYHAEKFYPAWADKNQLRYRINIIGNNYWLYLRPFELSINAEFLAKTQQIIGAARRTLEFNERRKKYFMCLNFKSRIHRVAIILFLLARNYLDKGIVTYFGRHNLYEFNPEELVGSTKTNSVLINFVKQLPEAEELIGQMDRFDELRPLTYDKELDVTLSEKWPLSQYIPEMSTYGDIDQFDTYFEIITETYFSDETNFFISEKTLRAFLRFQLFIVVGSPYTLKYLRSIGFQTFSPWIDESYDEIADPAKRMSAIFKEIDRLCSMSLDQIHQMYCELWPRVLHNFEHFTSQMRTVSKQEIGDIVNKLAVTSHQNLSVTTARV